MIKILFKEKEYKIKEKISFQTCNKKKARQNFNPSPDCSHKKENSFSLQNEIFINFIKFKKIY